MNLLCRLFGHKGKWLLNYCCHRCKTPFTFPSPIPYRAPKESSSWKKDNKSELEELSVFVGKKINFGGVVGEVVSINENAETFQDVDLELRILKISSSHMGTYLSEGETYALHRQERGISREQFTWEILGEDMKRSTSQFILAWERGIGFTCEIDS